MNFDSNGLIVQANGDGGDTAGREGDFWFLVGLTKNTGLGATSPSDFGKVMSLLNPTKGNFVRNPAQPAYNIPSDFSRDQLMPLVLALGLFQQTGGNSKSTLEEISDMVLKNFSRAPNRDIVGPTDYGVFIRAFNFIPFYPLLFLTDLGLVVESIIRVFAKSTDVSDDINHTLYLLQAQNRLATPVSWLARKIYKTFKNVQKAWDTYFAPKTGANDFNDLYRDLIDRM